MVSKLFLDANIILDILLKRQGEKDAKSILQLIVSGKYQGYITPLILHLVYYLGCKFQQSSDVKEFLISLSANVQIIDMEHDICIKALYSEFSDVEDALQYYTAISHGINYFISSDKKLKNRHCLTCLF